MRKLLWMGVAVLLLAGPSAAQGFDVSAGYVYERWSEDNLKFNMNGYAITGTGYMNRWFGLKGEFGQTFGCLEISPGFEEDTRHYWVLGGVVVSPYRNESGTFYLQALGGGGRLRIGDSNFSEHDNAGIIKLGAGFDWYPGGNEHFGFRVFEANYKSTWFFDSRQNVFQLQTGLVFSTGRR
jgi:hypothetical protein